MSNGQVALHALTAEFWEEILFFVFFLFWGEGEEGGVLLLLLLRRFIAFAQAVLNAKIFLLGELQLVAKGLEDAFTLPV